MPVNIGSREFARCAPCQWCTASARMLPSALLSGRQAVAVYGAYTPQEALELLLASTGLTIGTVRARSFTLKVVQSVPQTSRMPRWTMPAIAIS